MVKCSVSKAWKVDQVGRQDRRLEHLVIAVGEGLLCLAREFVFVFVFPMSLCLFIFSFIFISWRLITLQYCSGFCHTLT